MDRKLLSWSDYLYMGLALAILLSGRGENLDGFYQLLLVGVFFMLTGLIENIKLFASFSKKYPLLLVFTTIWTVYFGIVHRPDTISDRYALTVFGVIFCAYCISQKGNEYITKSFKKLWIVLLASIMMCDVNYALKKFSQGRMSMFFLNANIEGYAIISFLLISLLFVNEKRQKAIGVIISLVSALGTGSKSCTIIAMAIILVYFAGHIKDILAYAKKDKKNTIIILCFIGVMSICGWILASRYASKVFEQLFERFLFAFKDLANLNNGSQIVDYYSSTNLRLFDIKVALETFTQGSITDIILGRGLLQQYYHAIRPIMARIFFLTNETAGPAENTFLSLMYDYGAVSVVMLLGTFISAIVTTIKSNNSIVRILSSALVCLMILNLTVDMEYWPNIMFVVWAFIGMYLGVLESSDKKKFLFPSMLFVSILMIIIKLLPLANSYIVTLNNGSSLIGNRTYGILCKFAIISVIVASLGIMMAFCVIICHLFNEKCIRKSDLIFFGMTIIILAIGMYIGSFYTERIQNLVRSRIDKEKDTICKIIENSNGKLYVNTYPEVYNREIGGISRSVFSGRELACYDGITIITDISMNSYLYANNGFLYLPISDEDAIFTNDEGVISYFRNNGQWLTGYNYSKNVIDVNDADNKSIEAFMYAGTYTVTMDLSIENKNIDETETLCTIDILPGLDDGTGVDKDANVLSSAVITGSDFKKNNNCQYDLKCNIQNNGRVYFVIADENDNRITLNKIEYARTPEYDKHVILSENRDVIVENYYYLDGTPYIVSDGYCGIRYEYDDQRRVTRQEYLGTNQEPTVSKSTGYAILCKQYDEAGRIKREEYRGEDNKLIELAEGQAAIEYMYDELGRRSEQCFFDANNEPTLYNSELFCFKYEYNDKSQNVYETFYGTDMKPIARLSGAYGIKREYYENGSVAKLTYVGEDGNPILNTDGYSSVHYIFNDLRQVIREEYYDEYDNPVELDSGEQAVEYEYDEDYNRTIERYYDINNDPVLYMGKYWYVKRTYNADREIVSEEYYGMDDM